MDFSLTEAQKMLRGMVCDFALKELGPVAARLDEEARYPAEAMKKMGELGLMGLGFPEAYGGTGGGTIEQDIVIEEVSRVCAAAGVIYLVSCQVSGGIINALGTPEQKQRFLTPIARGEWIGAFSLTEAGAGSDATSLQTAATRRNGGYVINGTKMFSTNGAEAGVVVVFATIDRKLRHRGIIPLVVEKGTPGLSVDRVERKMGMRASSTAELHFEDCFVPEANRLGEEGQGIRPALEALDASRTGVAAQAVGIAQGAFDKALVYAKERRQFGQPIINFQALQWLLADMATHIEAARLLTYRAAWLHDRGLPFVKEASMAKVYAAETAGFVTTRAVQIHGGYGYTKDYPVERYFRDAKVTEIYEGTSEMQRLTIAKCLMREG
ncbi:MAG: acyl-CoA dehydrogenase family protein [Chloroflexi bacterium]|nr:acyl-CoA dehydrogenase family protein [Chloroflexota bacterium]